MNNTQNAQETVLGIKELRDHIFSYASPCNKAGWIFVSKHHYNLFISSTIGNFQQFLVKYCNSKLETNPRWAYHAYKCSGINPKDLSNYRTEAISDFPFKKTLAVIAVSMLANAFRVTNATSLLLPSIITFIYFLCAHILTLVALFKFNCCTNVKGLFRNMTIAMILLNLMIKIANVV